MPPTMPPDVAPMLSREKKIQPARPVKNGGNPMTLILLAMVAILLLAGLVRLFAKPSADTQTIQVVSAASDLPPGTKLGFTNLHYMMIPKSYYSPEMTSSYEGLVGYTTRTFIAQKEPILRTD